MLQRVAFLVFFYFLFMFIIQSIRMANLVILKCDIKQNLKKCLTCFLKDRRRKFLRFRINSNWKSLLLCPIKWQPLNIFAKLHKSPLLIANIVKRAVSGLRQFQATESPWKIMKKNLLHLNKLNILLASQILHILCIFI